MKNNKRTDDAFKAGGTPPVEWLHKQLSRRAGEVEFLRQHVFPNPVQPWEPAELMGGPLPATEVVKVPIFGNEQMTCSFYVTQPFRLIGRKLFAGLQPDRASLPEGPMRLCLCLTPEEEIETSIVLEDAGEFQLIADIEPELAAQWAESSQDWSGRPETVPFGLVLRPIGEKTDAR